MRNGWPTKDVYAVFLPGSLSEILTIANLRHAASRVWTCAESEFRLCWKKLCSRDNHWTTAPPYYFLPFYFLIIIKTQFISKLILQNLLANATKKSFFTRIITFYSKSRNQRYDDLVYLHFIKSSVTFFLFKNDDK